MKVTKNLFLVALLLSLILSIGAVTISEAAKELETAAKDNRLDVIFAKHDSTMKLYGKLLKMLDGKGNEDGDAEAAKSQEDEEDLILVVDDDIMNLRIAERLLGGRYRIACAASGREALEYFEHTHPELVPGI